MPVRAQPLPLQIVPLVSEERRKRLEEQKGFLRALRSPSLQAQLAEDERFVDLIDLAIDHYGVKQGQLSDALGISTAQVGRWRTGKNVPAVYGRAHVMAVIADLLEDELVEA